MTQTGVNSGTQKISESPLDNPVLYGRNDNGSTRIVRQRYTASWFRTVASVLNRSGQAVKANVDVAGIHINRNTIDPRRGVASSNAHPGLVQKRAGEKRWKVVE